MPDCKLSETCYGITLGKSLRLSKSHFPHLQIGIILTPTSLHGCEGQEAHANGGPSTEDVGGRYKGFLFCFFPVQKAAMAPSCHPWGSPHWRSVPVAEHGDICMFNSILSTRTICQRREIVTGAMITIYYGRKILEVKKSIPFMTLVSARWTKESKSPI